ncbi:MAG: DUF134 domain-containing protein, partial [Bacteroidetes bacterium]|nr:DUF134 domain-containing protein [Bacteroidota bacterium]MBU1578179.1 DUF134 domain-containing protein [Bacteroidota bacterium]
LCDYEGHNHHDAAKLMQVSRPTFTRIYAAARNKIATAFAEGRSIEIEGGSVYFDSNWFQCIFCGSYFNQPDPELPMTHCPLCGSQEVQSIEAEELNTLPNTK